MEFNYFLNNTYGAVMLSAVVNIVWFYFIYNYPKINNKYLRLVIRFSTRLADFIFIIAINSFEFVCVNLFITGLTTFLVKKLHIPSFETAFKYSDFIYEVICVILITLYPIEFEPYLKFTRIIITPYIIGHSFLMLSSITAIGAIIIDFGNHLTIHFNKECPICLENIKGFSHTLECGHIFHINCIASHNYHYQQRFYCPYCRQNVEYYRGKTLNLIYSVTTMMHNAMSMQ